jgi:hypothetical protein
VAELFHDVPRVAAQRDEDRRVRVPELVRRHAAREWVLTAVGEQLDGALEHGLEHALVDVVLVAPAASRRREQQIVEASPVVGFVLSEDVVQHWQQVDRAQARRRLGTPDLEAAAGEVQIADECVPRHVVARTGEDERPDQRVAPRRARLGRQVQLAGSVEDRDDLVDAVEVDGPLLGGLELALAGVDPNCVARDQVVLDGDLEDLPEASRTGPLREWFQTGASGS